MPSTPANGITIEYETLGERDNPPMLLIMGLGAQLIAWHDDFLTALQKRGFFVIRYDNRDVGRSTWFDEEGVPDVMAALAGEAKAAYLLSDMADDAAGLLDALGISSAHVLGVSMGGMIAQTLAITHPERVRSLVSIMSTTGNPEVGQAHEAAMEMLLKPLPPDREGVMGQAVETWRVIGSPGFAFDEERVRALAGRAYDRGFHPEGAGRQLVGVLCSGDRTAALGQIDCPTLVIHGEADPLVDPSGGRATAEAIPGAELLIVAGMGHHLPPELFEDMADRIAAHAHSNDERFAR